MHPIISYSFSYSVHHTKPTKGHVNFNFKKSLCNSGNTDNYDDDTKTEKFTTHAQYS